MMFVMKICTHAGFAITKWTIEIEKMINYCIIGLLFYYVTDHVYLYETLFFEVWVRFNFTLCSFVFQ